MDMTAGSELTPIPDLTPLTSPDQLPAGDEGAQTFGKLLEEIAELVFQAGGSSILLPADIQVCEYIYLHFFLLLLFTCSYILWSSSCLTQRRPQ